MQGGRTLGELSGLLGVRDFYIGLEGILGYYVFLQFKFESSIRFVRCLCSSASLTAMKMYKSYKYLFVLVTYTNCTVLFLLIRHIYLDSVRLNFFLSIL